MTCYQRHTPWLFEALDLSYEKDARRRLDSALRDVLGFGDEAHCPEVWAAIKDLDQAQRDALVAGVAEVLGLSA
jgi:hypothetical protein